LHRRRDVVTLKVNKKGRIVLAPVRAEVRALGADSRALVRPARPARSAEWQGNSR